MDRIETARDINNRNGLLIDVLKMFGKSLRVNRRGRNNEFKVRAFGENFSKVAQEKVDVQTAFMRLVDNDRIVGFKQSVALSLCQQDAVGH